MSHLLLFRHRLDRPISRFHARVSASGASDYRRSDLAEGIQSPLCNCRANFSANGTPPSRYTSRPQHQLFRLAASASVEMLSSWHGGSVPPGSIRNPSEPRSGHSLTGIISGPNGNYRVQIQDKPLICSVPLTPLPATYGPTHAALSNHQFRFFCDLSNGRPNVQRKMAICL